MTQVETHRPVRRVGSAVWPAQNPLASRPTARAAARVAAHVKVKVLARVEADPVVRRVLTFCYAAATIGGVLGFLTQPPAIVSETSTLTARVWGVYMVLGAGSCLVGLLMPRGAHGDWFGEYVGLWFLMSAVVLCGFAVVMSGRAPVAGVLLLALTPLLYLRWRVVKARAHQDCRPPTPAADR